MKVFVIELFGVIRYLLPEMFEYKPPQSSIVFFKSFWLYSSLLFLIFQEKLWKLTFVFESVPLPPVLLTFVSLSYLCCQDLFGVSGHFCSQNAQRLTQVIIQSPWGFRRENWSRHRHRREQMSHYHAGEISHLSGRFCWRKWNMRILWKCN